MNRFKVVLATQWKWAWGAVLLSALLMFCIPILSVQKAILDHSGRTAAVSEGWSEALHFLSVMEFYAPWYTVTAAGIGLALAILAWSSDHRGRHVYSLTLPIERWRLVLLRYMSGVAMLLIPAVALLVGATLAASNTVIPDGLQAYQVALSFRFMLAATVAFSLFFAISSGTTRTAGLVLAPLGALVVADVIMSAVGIKVEIMDSLLQAALEWPGVLQVFTGRWSLVDV